MNRLKIPVADKDLLEVDRVLPVSKAFRIRSGKLEAEEDLETFSRNSKKCLAKTARAGSGAEKSRLKDRTWC